MSRCLESVIHSTSVVTVYLCELKNVVWSEDSRRTRPCVELAIELTETNLTINTTEALFYSLSPFY